MNNLGRGSENKKKDKDRILTRETVGFVLVLFAAIALVILISRSVIFGSVGAAISNFLLGTFGYCSYAVLAALVYGGVVLISGKKIAAKRKTVALCLLAFVFFVCLIHTITSQVGGIDSRSSYGGYLAACYRAGENSFFRTTGGGVIIGLIVYPVVRLTTYVGGYIIFSLLLAATAYFIYTSRNAAAGERRRRKQEEEKMVGAASADTSGLYDLNYAENSAPVQPQANVSAPYAPSAPQAGTQPYMPQAPIRQEGYPQQAQPQQSSDPSKRLFAVGDEFAFKTKREMRQDRREQSARKAEQPPAQPQQPMSPYAQSRSILYPENVSGYTSNLIFDSNSYFNNPNRGIISEQQYSDNFRSTPSAFSEGHERSNRTEPPRAETKPQASASSPSYSSLYSDAAESNITYTNKPKKIVTDTTRPSDTAQPDSPVSTYRAEGDYYRKDVNTSFSAGEGFSSQRPVSSFTDRQGSDIGAVRENTSAPIPPARNAVPPAGRTRPVPSQDSEASGAVSDSVGESRVTGFTDRSVSPRREEPENVSQPPAEPPKRDRIDESVRFMPPSDYEQEKKREEEEERSTLQPITDDFDSAVNLFDSEEEDEAGESIVPEASERLRREEPAEEPLPSRRGDVSGARAVPAAEPEQPKKKHIYARYAAPPISMLNDYQSMYAADGAEVEHNKETITDTLYQLKIPSEILSVTQGPTVTRYDIDIPGNIPASRVLSCDKELAMRLHAKDGVNIQTNYENGSISIEVPNKQKATVGLKEMIQSDTFANAKPGSIMFGLGKDIEGRSICGDIKKMKHLLVAGSTGSGKSVCLNALIISLLYKYSPEDLRLILVDPKQVEFNIYDKLPHLMINEIIFEPGKVITVLNWAITEMERRYGLFKAKTKSGTLVREIDEYNAHLNEDEEKLPKIVMIIDELADLMTVAKKDIEDRIQRLTQKSRAAGIHLVLATQRPSTDVITGIIKSNLPTRIAFKVVQEVDSRTILDSSGAEKLLGNGDMLYKMDTMTFPYRVQGAFLSSEEVQNVVEYIKEHNEAYFDESVSDFINNSGSGGMEGGGDSDDSVEAVYIEALRYVVSIGQASISMIQRKCSVGYPKAGKIIEWMENMGYISAFDGAKSRKVLLTQEEFESKYGDYGN